MPTIAGLPGWCAHRNIRSELGRGLIHHDSHVIEWTVAQLMEYKAPF